MSSQHPVSVKPVSNGKWRAFSVALLAGIFLVNFLSGQIIIPATDYAGGEQPDKTNSITLVMGGSTANGNEAAMQSRSNTSGDLFIGIESLEYYKLTDTDINIDLNLRALVDENDYRAVLKLSHEDWGSLEIGYEEFRTWDSPHGGFMPTTGRWFSGGTDALALDNSKIWLEAVLKKFDTADFYLRLAQIRRQGLKSSTVWGTAGNRKMRPAVLEIDEKTTVVEVEAKKTTEETNWGIGAHYEKTETDNTSHVTNSVGINRIDEAAQNQKINAHTDSAHAYMSRMFKERLTLSAGVFWAESDANIGGFRQVPDGSAFENLTGDANLEISRVNLGAAFKIMDDLQISSSYAVKELKQDVTDTRNLATPYYDVASYKDWENEVVRVDLKYNGIKNAGLYAYSVWDEGDGLMSETGDNIIRNQDARQTANKYAIGAHVYPAGNIKIHARFLHQERENDFIDERLDNSRRSIFPGVINGLDICSDQFDMRVSWRPNAKLVLNTKYIVRESETRVRQPMLTMPEYNVEFLSEHKSTIFTQTATWMPLSKFYLFASYSNVHDDTSTPVRGTGVLENRVPLLSNDYWNSQCSAYVILNKKTDLEVTWLHYRADNFINNAQYALPFGSGARENRINALISRKVDDQTRLFIRYSWFDSSDDSAGGNLDYEASLIYAGVQRRF